MHHFKAFDINFIEDKDIGPNVRWMPVINNKHLIKYGIVCNYVQDRCDPIDTFVIIDSYNNNEKDTIIKIIYPRIRVVNDQISVGKDKSTDNPNIYLIDNYGDQETQFDYTYNTNGTTCKKMYSKTFESVTEADYIIYEVNVNKCDWYLEYTYLNTSTQYINSMDWPTFFNNPYSLM